MKELTVDEIEFVASLADSEIRARLSQRGVHPNVVEDLIRDRSTNGGRWRIVQELNASGIIDPVETVVKATERQ